MSAPLRIVFMGTPDFAVPSLQALIEGPNQVVAVVCQPDRQRGRGKVLSPPPVKVLAEQHDIPVLQPPSVRKEPFLEQLRELAPDLLVVVAYGKILPSCPAAAATPRGDQRPWLAPSQIPGRGPDPVGGDQRRNRDRHHHHAAG